MTTGGDDIALKVEREHLVNQARKLGRLQGGVIAAGITAKQCGVTTREFLSAFGVIICFGILHGLACRKTAEGEI